MLRCYCLVIAVSSTPGFQLRAAPKKSLRLLAAPAESSPKEVTETAGEGRGTCLNGLPCVAFGLPHVACRVGL